MRLPIQPLLHRVVSWKTQWMDSLLVFTGKFLVTSDDYGLVKLFNYPCVVEDAPYRAYRGHSSHVMCVRYNCDESLVCSAGGKDRAIFQFKFAEFQPTPPPEPEAEPVWGPLSAKGVSPKLDNKTKQNEMLNLWAAHGQSA